MPIILAIQEAEIRRIVVQGQPGQTVNETSCQPIKKAGHVPVILATQEA
jgi:hypothetical protein